jgi:HAD superfamily hydrolase (TIGR01549 family)
LTNFHEYKKTHHNIKGIFYDFDGTLVDSREKNYNVTKMIAKSVTGRAPESYSILKSRQNYLQALQKSSNWRDFYHNHFKLSHEKTDYAGSLWTDYQMRDDTPAPIFQGISQLLDEFKNVKHAVISQNSSELIQKILIEDSLEKYFSFIVGYEEVGIRNQKPDPEGLIKSMEKVKNPLYGTFIYIGDHESDVEFTRNANNYLKEHTIEAKVISIAVHYQSESDHQSWKQQPDFHAHSVTELGNILRRLI